MKRTKFIFLFIFILLIFTLNIKAVEQTNQFKKSQPTENLYKKLELLADAITLIQSNYVEETSPRQLIYGALNGMLSSLDSHSQFLNPEAYEEIKVETEGEFGGLGIVITIRDKILTIITPLEDTPADKAGLQSGDRIVEINGESTKDITLTEAVKKLRGEPKTKVEVTVLREKEDKILKFNITRDIIKIKSVKKAEILEDNIGYIKLVDFQEDTAKELDEAMEKLINEGMDSLILDLRNNAGGLLKTAVEVCERFVPKGKLIVSTKGRKESQNFRFISKESKKYTQYPLVVLVNQGSASGSEIVAGAIQDHHLGIILGTNTFGKASVQTVIPLSDDSALRLTTSKYFTPRGRSIHEKGIVPDIEVEYKKIEKVEEKTKEEEVFDRLKQKNVPREEIKEEKLEKVPYDSQLLRAIDLLKAIKIYQEYNIDQGDKT